AADTYRPNPSFDTAEAIREVGTGEAVTSMLIDKGVPGIVERTLIRPPSSQLGPITKAERAAVMAASPMSGKYNERLDRDSAAEMLAKRAKSAAEEAEKAEAAEDKLEAEEREHRQGRRYSGKDVERSTSRRSSKSESWGGAIATVVAKELKGTTGRRIVRGILGGLFKGR
ncbi:MAG: helicase HerA-like domain-containing protein, partial [Octadecabacter sp.]